MIVIWFILSRTKIINEHERFAVFTLGKFQGLKGPGLLLKFSGSESQWIRLRLGDRGDLLSNEIGRFHDKDIPIVYYDKINIGSMIQINGFEVDKCKIISAPDQLRVLKCEKCGHEMRV